jgi:hypothetical protein
MRLFLAMHHDNSTVKKSALIINELLVKCSNCQRVDLDLLASKRGSITLFNWKRWPGVGDDFSDN